MNRRAERDCGRDAQPSNSASRFLLLSHRVGLGSARIHRMRGGGPEGPETGDGLGGFAGLRWEQARRVDVSGFPGGRRGALILAVADAAAIAIAVTLIAASLILGRPIGGVVLLLGPGILLLVVGR